MKRCATKITPEERARASRNREVAILRLNAKKRYGNALVGSLPNGAAGGTKDSDEATAPPPKPRLGWGGLRPSTAKDIAPRQQAKGLSSGPPPYSHVVVLDFEWTCDEGRPWMDPTSEITQFPSVLVRLEGARSRIIDEFDTFVRPNLNPTLTAFATKLTGITQAQVDAAPPLDVAMQHYLGWLRSHGLVADDDNDAQPPPHATPPAAAAAAREAAARGTGGVGLEVVEAGRAPSLSAGHGRKVGHWAMVTWTDADLGRQLPRELRHKGLGPVPSCLAEWVNLKTFFERHYGRPARGGLEACVRSLGLAFEGRAHNGLVDARNTAQIVVHMAQGSPDFGAFVFKRPTRSLDSEGKMHGAAKWRESPRGLRF